jgi:hypothetical protein
MSKQSTLDQTVPEIRTPTRGKADAFKRLSSHLQSGEKISLEICCSCQPILNGYLLGLSRQLGMIHCFHEFMPDGYIVFRLANVTSIRCSGYDRFMNRMLAGEGLLDGLKTSLQIDLETIATAITSINTRYATMILETEIPKDGYSDFFIGQIESIDSTRLRFNHFDALGRNRP